MKEFWNERFSKDEFIYGKKPNSFLKSEIDKISKRGIALFPLEGEGRNACYAAKQGWEVEAFDFSEAGKNKAMSLCNSQDVSISYDINKAEDFKFEENKYDLIALIYAHLNPELRKKFHKNVFKSLKPEGKVIVEAFHPNQLTGDYKSGGPKNREMLYSLDMLEKDFRDLAESQGEELEIDLNEGQFHRGKGFITRFTGVK
ncbi:class I SAM-dependent methyltransferase [Psychroflexus sediminis]|uniref:Methyltransferase domain-containing protein n=1 Tax=Psychroflexus sediminis TaxID=470826 RepID=A0A1G7WTJ5_9FLAO|nr:class I SAM-dependent methyltransferase [Psychroflexus sediminis]SDG75239.1 Methyltransferase domain-containing protein [Psychroflexus sediminis]